MEKQEFIQKISNLSREEINELIQKKGKKAKKLKLFYYIRKWIIYQIIISQHIYNQIIKEESRNG